MNRTVIVLGASGFIGRNVCICLAERGWQVHAIVRSQTNHVAFSDSNIHRHVLELQNISGLKSLTSVGEFGNVGIVNCIGYGVNPEDRDPNIMNAVNVTFPTELARHAGEWGAALIHLGSSSEYAPLRNSTKRISEDAETETKLLYGSSKARGSVEAIIAAQNSRCRLSILRLFNIYGPGKSAHRLSPTLIEGARKKTSVAISSGTQIRDFLYVKDVATAIELQLEKLLSSDSTEAPMYNLCSGEGVSRQRLMDI